jgi:hypothetical protein
LGILHGETGLSRSNGLTRSGCRRLDVESEHITIARPESLGKRALDGEFVYILAMDAEGGGQPWMSIFSVKSTKRTLRKTEHCGVQKGPGRRHVFQSQICERLSWRVFTGTSITITIETWTSLINHQSLVCRKRRTVLRHHVWLTEKIWRIWSIVHQGRIIS